MALIARSAILQEARSWLGTPYQHQASIKHAGCDCLGLVRGVWRALIGPEPQEIPAYTPDWAERDGRETLLAAAQTHMHAIALADVLPGDIILFRMCADAPAKHVAILEKGDRLIHAYWGRAVVTSRFGPWWRARAAYAFSFPGAGPWPS